MVKATDTKSSATQAHKQQSQQPFFNKEEGNALSHEESAEKGTRAPFFVQRKLNIGQSNDHFEKEADSVADKVVQRLSQPATEPAVQAKAIAQAPAPPAITSIPTPAAKPAAQPEPLQMKEETEGKEEEEVVQRKPIFDSMADPPEEHLQRKPIFDSMADPREESVQRKEADATTADTAHDGLQQRLQSTKGSGEPLPADTRTTMESSIGADFSGVRIHNNSNAVQLSRELNAQAFTHGSDIYFNSGKYDTSSQEGKHLLAHELTHTVQQGKAPAVQRKIQPTTLNIQKEDAPVKTDQELVTEAGELTGEGFLTWNGSAFEISLTDFPLKPYASLANIDASADLVMPKGKRESDQATLWRQLVKDDVAQALKSVADKAGIVDKGQILTLTLRNQARNSDELREIRGKMSALVNEIVVPFWDNGGHPRIHQIEHKVDYQILGGKADTKENLILIDQQSNSKLGNQVRKQIEAKITKIIKHYETKGVKDPIVTSKAAAIIAGPTVIRFKSFKPGDPIETLSTISSSNLTPSAVNNPINERIIKLEEKGVPEDHFVFTTAKRGAGYVVPYVYKNKFIDIKGNKENGGTLDHVRLIKFVEDKTSGLETEEIDKVLPMTKKGPHEFKLEDKNYAGMVKTALRMKYMSPIVLNDDFDFNPITGIYVTGKVKSDIPLLKDADIDFVISGNNFTVTASIGTDAFSGKLPKPLNLDYAGIFISASTKEGLAVGGEIGFSINKVGKGSVSASGGSNGFVLKGDFNFDNADYFKKAALNFEYANKKWKIGGELVVDKGKIKGVESGSIAFSYGDDTLTAAGHAKLSIPGISDVALLATFADNGDFSITGDATLNKVPGLKSGQIKVTIANKGAGYELSMSGSAVPDLARIPGLDASFAISYDKGLFKAEGKAAYKKGKIDGAMMVGVTNASLDDKGNPVPGTESDSLTIYGSGKVIIYLLKDLKAELNAAVDQKGELLIWGSINVDASPFEHVKTEKSLFEISKNIPLVGVPMANIFLRLGADAKFYFDWEPLKVKMDLTLEKSSLDDIEKGKLGGALTVGLHSKAKAGVKLTISVGVGVAVTIVAVSANINGTAGLEIEADLGADVAATWSAEKGLVIKGAEAILKATPKAFVELSGNILVELDLFFDTIPVYKKDLGSARKEIDLSEYGLNVKVPINFNDNGDLEGIDYERMSVSPEFNAAMGERLVDKALGNEKEPGKEDAVRQKIRKDIAQDLRAQRGRSGADLRIYAANLKQRIMQEAPPELSSFVDQVTSEQVNAIERENAAREARVQPKETPGETTPGSADAPALQDQLDSSKGKGATLPPAIKENMESAIGADFSGVNIHTDAEAQQMSNELHAQAFTHGNDIYFNKGKYDPDSQEGQRLLAHELTHTIQQGAAPQQPATEQPAAPAAEPATQTDANVQKAPAKTAPAAPKSNEVVNIANGNFQPSAALKEMIRSAREDGMEVKISAGKTAGAGTIKVKEKDGVLEGKSLAFLPMNMPLFQAANPVLAVKLQNGQISGFATIGTSKDPDSIPKWLRNNGKALGWLSGVDVDKVAAKATNEFKGGAFNFGINNARVKVGKAADGNMNLGVANGKLDVQITANMDVKGMAKGQLNILLKDNMLAGVGSFGVNFSSFAGEIAARFANGTLDVRGTVSYEANRLKGSLTLVMTDKATADNFARSQVKAAGNNPAAAALPAEVPVAGEKPGPKALAGMGSLSFQLTEWLTGSVNVIVDGKGDVTVVGKIAPPKEIILFDQKDYSKELFKLEARAAYGLPVIGNVFVFANMALIALAKVGPAKIYNIELEGTYSTDPDIAQSISLSGSLNISAYAGLRLRAEGGAGIEILDHDLKVGVGINADAGVKGYVDARPTIGYRDPGEFFIKGHMEIAAQPFLGLSGDLFVEVDSPWWSPLPDDKWTWPIGSLEYPLPGEFGIGADVDYVLGSGKAPEIKFGEANFDGQKFMTDLVDDNVPKKGGAGKGDKQGKFVDGGAAGTAPAGGKGATGKGADKGGKGGGKGAPAGGKGDAPKGPAPKPATGKGGAKGGGKGKPDKAGPKTDDVKNFADAMKAVKSLEQRTKPMTRDEISTAIDSIKKRFKVPGITFTAQGTEWWMVTGSLKGQPNKQSAKVKALMKPGDDKDKKGKDKEKQQQLDSAIKALKAADEKKAGGDKNLKREEAEQVAQNAKKDHNKVFKSISVIDAGKHWKYHYIQRAEDGDVDGSKVDEPADERIKRMDDGVMSVEDRQKLLATVLGIVGEHVVANIFSSTKTGKQLIKLFEKVISEHNAKGLTGGFRFKTLKTGKNAVLFSYFGFQHTGDKISLGALEFRAGKAEVQNRTLSLNFAIQRFIKPAVGPGVGTKMLEAAMDMFKGEYDAIHLQWVQNSELYPDDKFYRSDNLIRFQEALAPPYNKSLEDAARATWSFKTINRIQTEKNSKLPDGEKEPMYDVRPGSVSAPPGSDRDFAFLDEFPYKRKYGTVEKPKWPFNIVEVNVILDPVIPKK